MRAGAVLQLLLGGLEGGPVPGLAHLLLGYDVDNGVAGGPGRPPAVAAAARGDAGILPGESGWGPAPRRRSVVLESHRLRTVGGPPCSSLLARLRAAPLWCSSPSSTRRSHCEAAGATGAARHNARSTSCPDALRSGQPICARVVTVRAQQPVHEKGPVCKNPQVGPETGAWGGRFRV